LAQGSPSRTFLSALSQGDMSLENADNQDAEALLTPKLLLAVDQPHHGFRAAKIGGLTLSVFLAIIALGSTRSASSALCPIGGVESAISPTGNAPTRRLYNRETPQIQWRGRTTSRSTGTDNQESPPSLGARAFLH